MVLCATLFEFNKALMLYEDLSLADALEYLSDFFDEKQREHCNRTEAWLVEQFLSLKNRIKRHTEHNGEPYHPKLTVLSQHLRAIYTSKSDSKVFVFTASIYHTVALMNWLKNNKALECFLRPGRLVGSHASAVNGKSSECLDILTYNNYPSISVLVSIHQKLDADNRMISFLVQKCHSFESIAELLGVVLELDLRF